MNNFNTSASKESLQRGENLKFNFAQNNILEMLKTIANTDMAYEEVVNSIVRQK